VRETLTERFPLLRADRTHHRVLAREAMASALYLALVLLTGLLTVPRGSLPSDAVMVELIFGAGLGLLVMHWFSFRLAAHITAEDGTWTATASQEAAAQLVGGFVVATLAALPFLLLDGTTAWLSDLLLLSALPAVAGGWIARLRGRSWSFTLLSGLLTFLLACGVVALKSALSH